MNMLNKMLLLFFYFNCLLIFDINAVLPNNFLNSIKENKNVGSETHLSMSKDSLAKKKLIKKNYNF